MEKDPTFEEFKKEQDTVHSIMKALEKLPLNRRRAVWEYLSRAFGGSQVKTE